MRIFHVFVSSTRDDLIEERNAVMQCLVKNRCIPISIEEKPLRDSPRSKYTNKLMDYCDLFILILAGKYGTEDEDGISFVEKEYNCALYKNIPIISFVIKGVGKLSLSKCEQENQLRKKLLSFRNKVCSTSKVEFYSNIDDLSNIADHFIQNYMLNLPSSREVGGNDLNIIDYAVDNKNVRMDTKKHDACQISIDAFIAFISSINIRIWNDALEDAEKRYENEHLGGVFSIFRKIINQGLELKLDIKQASDALQFYCTLYNIARDQSFILFCDYLTNLSSEIMLSHNINYYENERAFAMEHMNDFGESGLPRLFVEKMNKEEINESKFWINCCDEFFILYSIVSDRDMKRIDAIETQV